MTVQNQEHVDRRGIGIVMEAVHDAGWIFREQSTSDHGIDAHLESVIDDTVTGRLIAAQIKTGDSYLKESTDEAFIYRGDQEHLDYWINHSLPVLLLLVDPNSREVFWAHVKESAITSTGKGWKIEVPKKQRLDASALEALSEIAVNIKIRRPYSRLRLDDSSHANAKRYSAHILLNIDFAQDYVKALVSEITQELALETWQRSPALEARFRGHKADVIWLYLCRTVEDAKQANWLCRTQWIASGLHEDFRPIPISDTKTEDGIHFVWSESRHEMEEFAMQHELSKGEFVDTLRPILTFVLGHMERHRAKIEAFIESPTANNPSIAELRSAADEAREVYLRSTDLGLPPLELADLSSQFDCVVSSLDNAFLPFQKDFSDSAEARRAAALATSALSMFDRDLQSFQHEATKHDVRA